MDRPNRQECSVPARCALGLLLKFPHELIPFALAQIAIFKAISAFNSTDRVRGVYEKISADHKYWIIHNEYDYEAHELPAEHKYVSTHEEEGTYVRTLISQIESDLDRDISLISICVDITGS